MKNNEKSFNKLLEDSIKRNWDFDALTDYHGETLKYKDVARRIEKVHIILDSCGLKKGDKVALCGRNSSNWGIAMLATLTFGCVAVPILHEFKASNIHDIVNHSGAKLLFVGDMVWENINEKAMPLLAGIVLINDFSALVSRNRRLAYSCENNDELFIKRFPKDFRRENIMYFRDKPEDLAIINYTSGTTSFSKGVMLPFRSIYANVTYAIANMPLEHDDSTISMLPLAHMYGLSFEFLFELCIGSHVYFLTRIPSPKIVFQAFAEIKPRLIIAVPLIIEKIIQKNVMPKLESVPMKILMKLPVISDVLRTKIRNEIVNAFGGNFKEVVLGGAPFCKEVEDFLHRIAFPYTIGYGMTECGPLITYSYWKDFEKYSSGKPIEGMEMKIVSPDPQHVVGEILCRGKYVMTGYYKNPKATAQALDKDGWLHTGDLGLIDKNGFLFIKGRSKNMLLSSNGQNIYPEEIEDKLKTLPYVSECLVVQKESKLVALIYPDFEQTFADKMDNAAIEKVMEQNRITLNSMLPAYSAISKVKIIPEEFEKTPKRSIKRFLYQ
jgi:long-chain acyl-CoA synthetase